ncbi:hypothetical protein FC682_23965 [Peribacillus simplex]|uniref:hypothetical protein n=1 Tax=Peribacillus simplex TaxID=1478 RepID=UPI0010BE3480|nr:hypothetical protein [Peribacillus simplex]TKH00660.1 hypothetical protein FC682_23965 [Peribacillus simplex]
MDTKTNNQYKGLLKYRFKNWKPATPKKKQMNIIRTENVLEWFHKEKEPKQVENEDHATDADLKERKAALEKMWAEYKQK